MDFSVKDVLSLDVMEKSRLLSCHDAIAQLPVESISVIELPVENFVREHEFILTTGIGYGQDEQQFQQFVRDVKAGHASAIGVATGRHILSIPPSVLDLAEQERIPLIEIPWEVRFSDIIHDVLASLQSEQRRLLQESNAIQKELLALILNSSGLTDIANFIKEKTGSPLLIVDRRGSIVGRSQNAEELARMWTDASHSTPTPVRPYAARPLAATLNSVAVEPVSNRSKDGRFLKLPVRSASDVHGYLVFSLPSQTSVNALIPIELAHIVEHAATAAALCFLRLNLIQETEIQMRRDFVHDLLKSENQSWDTIAAQAKFLGYELANSYVCMVGVVENLTRMFQQGRYDVSLETWTKTLLDKLEAIVLDSASLERRHTLATVKHNEVVVLVSIAEDEEQVKSLNSFIDQIERTVDDLLPDVVLSWGIGDIHDGPRCFQTSYQEAHAALEMGYRKEGQSQGQRTHFTDVELHRALSRLAATTDMQRLVGSILGKLVDYDHQKGMDLRSTLEVYLRYQGNVSQTSRQLNLHRQTLVYRLRKIESLTGRSLVDPDDLFLLDLALRVISVNSGAAVE